jgi:hypothetical protein
MGERVTASLKDFAATVLIVLALTGFLSTQQAVGAYHRISRTFDAVSTWVNTSADPAGPPRGRAR